MKPILAFYGIQDRYSGAYPSFTHDHNLTLFQDGKVRNYIHLERLTRRKNDNRLSEYIEEIIDNQLLLKEDFELVSVSSFVGNSFISKNGRLRVESTTLPTVDVLNAANGWFQKSSCQGKAIPSWVVSQELAHVFSCLPFFGNFKENSLLIHFDGGASMGNFSAFHFKKNQLQTLECHWELSHLSKIFNDNALAFSLMKAAPEAHCSVPGKLMGYATMGQADNNLEKWLIENNYFKDIWNDPMPFYLAAQKLGWNGNLNQNEDPFLMNVAASLQSIFQKETVNKIQSLQKNTKAEYLYYTGGCALNITTNSKIIQSNLFKDVFIPPACNDSGLSLGAAAFLNWKKNNPIEQHTAYLNFEKKQSPISFSNNTITEVAKRIIAGQIIGICNKEGEAGPRALGNRSIVARLDNKAIAKKVSMNCKGREWFRPIAPIMLERYAKQVTGLKSIHHLSKFMLLDFPILEKYNAQLSGVIHKNNTARIQTIFSRQENPFMHDLLDYLAQHHHQLGLINTSFNYQGEPIVQTKEEAFLAAQKMQLNGVVLDGKFQAL